MRFRVCFALSALAAAMIMTPFTGASQAADPTPPAGKQIRVGMIGLDTSHVVAFTSAINKPDARPELRRLTCSGISGRQSGFADSWDRVKGYTEKVQKLGVEIVDSSTRCCRKSMPCCWRASMAARTWNRSSR